MLLNVSITLARFKMWGGNELVVWEGERVVDCGKCGGETWERTCGVGGGGEGTCIGVEGILLG